jgi:hypothetical protein
MVQLLDETGGAAEFASPVSLLQPWLALLSSTVIEAELQALYHAVNAACCELDAYHSAERALSCLQRGFPEYVMDWFTNMLHAIGRASWQWGQAASWLKEFGDPQQAFLYQPLFQQVLLHQQRLTLLVERFQGQITRYCQEWGLVLPEQQGNNGG